MAKSIYSAEQERFRSLLRETRTAAGLTQVDLASRIRRPQSFIAKIEAGERRLDVIELRQVCQAMGITLPAFVDKLERALKR